MRRKESYLVQILLPLQDNAGKRFPWKLYENVKQELTENFKGLTAYMRSPAEGMWKPGKETRVEDIVVFEAMTSSLNKEWWRSYRKRLEQMFRQESIVVRAQKTEVL